MNKQQPVRQTLFYQKILLFAAGILIAGTLLETGLNLGGGVLVFLQEYRNREALRQPDTYRIMCIGESTTQGQYPWYLQDFLNRQNTGRQFYVVDKGLAGVTSNSILEQLPEWIETYHPQMVVSMMGINDRAQHLPSEEPVGGALLTWLRALKTYKLIRFCWLHVSVKFHIRERWLGFKIACKPAETVNYIELSRVRYALRNYSAAEDILRKGVLQGGDRAELFNALAEISLSLGRKDRAAAYFIQATAHQLRTAEYYVKQGDFFQHIGKMNIAEMFYSKGIAAHPRDGNNYHELAKLYFYSNRDALAEQVINKGLLLEQKDSRLYCDLGWVYLRQNKADRAVSVLGGCRAIGSESDRISGALATLYREQHGAYPGSEFYRKADSPARITVLNYRKLHRLLKAEHVDFVAMQYPMRKLEPLRNIFSGDTKDIVFIDNEQVFREAVARKGYRAYFKDMFGGDFGHCTREGNRLLAENAAGAILKKLNNLSGY